MKTKNIMPVYLFKITGIIVLSLACQSFISNEKHPIQNDCSIKDTAVTTKRNQNNMNDKLVIYQVFTRLFGNSNISRIPNGTIEQNGCGKMNDFTNKALKEIKELGITHIWFTGLLEHATKSDYSKFNIPKDNSVVVKGNAGSPYAVKDYYNVDPDLAVNVDKRMEEFEDLINRTHANGLKTIMDFVPNHVSRQYKSISKPTGVKDLGEDDDTSQAFSPKNNFYYIPGTTLGGVINLYNSENEPYIEMPAKATGNDRFDATPNASDWYETIKLNYGVDYMNNRSRHFDPIPDTWIKMRDILLFWTAKGVDGFRCDMAEMVPVEFWEWTIPQIKIANPNIIFIAEIYNPGEYKNYIYKGKFDYLYDKVGLYDTLRAVTCGYESATAITGRWQSLQGIETRMLNFLENHDEQRIASDEFAGNGLKAIPAMIISACMNTNPVMVYFGQELGEKGMDNEGYSGRDGRTTIFDYWSIDSYWRLQIAGKYTDKYLHDDEKELRDFYTRLLNLCKKEKAISNGTFFDLTYANLGKVKYNEHKMFSFLRKFNDELILIVVNFDSIPVNCEINIPAHAFEYMNIPQNIEFEYEDLLNREKGKIMMMPDKNSSLKVNGYGGKILKIKL